MTTDGYSDADGVVRYRCTVCHRRIGARYNGSGASLRTHKPLLPLDADRFGRCKGSGEWAGGLPSGSVFAQ